MAEVMSCLGTQLKWRRFINPESWRRILKFIATEIQVRGRDTGPSTKMGEHVYHRRVIEALSLIEVHLLRNSGLADNC